MNYYITEKNIFGENAGAKAPRDVAEICSELGWTPLVLTRAKNNEFLLKRVWCVIKWVLGWFALSIKVNPEEVVLYQYPMYFGMKVAKRAITKMSKKKVKTVLLIHDIDQLRKQLPEEKKKEELEFFNLFNYIICHNDSMRGYLVNNTISEAKVYVLNLFDYLCNRESAKESDAIIIAGNLDPVKAEYVYEFAACNQDLTINLYGSKPENKNGTANAIFCGSYKPDELPHILEGKYGLVWDGTSIDGCCGDSGKYLMYNNPHKASLYIVAGIPVITWSRAAIASYITEKKLGFVVDDLREIKKKISKISEDEYCEMKQNCEKLGKSLSGGNMLRSVLADIEKKSL